MCVLSDVLKNRMLPSKTFVSITTKNVLLNIAFNDCEFPKSSNLQITTKPSFHSVP